MKRKIVEFNEEAWAKVREAGKNPRVMSAAWQRQVNLFRDIETCLGEDPAVEKAQELARRWIAHIEATSLGDPAVQAGLMKGWADRPNWTATRRWLEEGLSMLTGERFDRAADFIDKAARTQNNAGLLVL